MTTPQFVQTYGSPAKFSFRGQCYDARIPSTMCVCGRKIRFCFIVYSASGQRLTLGSCCFKHFVGTRLADILEASQVYLLNTVVEAQKAARAAAERQAALDSRKAWNQARREALKRIRAHRKASGKKWLPEALWDIQQAVEASQPRYQRSSRAARWFQAKTEYLQKKLAEISQTSIMGHEVSADNQS